MRNELTRAQKGLRDELQTLRAQLLDELDKHFRAVQEAKVSKDEMSEVLFEFGMRIKGLEIVTDLPRLPVSGHVDDSRGDRVIAYTGVAWGVYPPPRACGVSPGRDHSALSRLHASTITKKLFGHGWLLSLLPLKQVHSSGPEETDEDKRQADNTQCPTHPDEDSHSRNDGGRGQDNGYLHGSGRHLVVVVRCQRAIVFGFSELGPRQ
jgi:hypothetical protein